jgi:hypothetical protein
MADSCRPDDVNGPTRSAVHTVERLAQVTGVEQPEIV